jgi:hypothetical protein
VLHDIKCFIHKNELGKKVTQLGLWGVLERVVDYNRMGSELQLNRRGERERKRE